MNIVWKRSAIAAASAAVLAASAASTARADWSLASYNSGTVTNGGSMASVRNDLTVNSSASIQAAGAATSFTGTAVAAGAVNPAGLSLKGAATNTGTVTNGGSISAARNVGSYGASISIGSVGSAASATYNMGAFAH